jgi:hypothetical protein
MAAQAAEEQAGLIRRSITIEKEFNGRKENAERDMGARP